MTYGRRFNWGIARSPLIRFGLADDKYSVQTPVSLVLAGVGRPPDMFFLFRARIIRVF